MRKMKGKIFVIGVRKSLPITCSTWNNFTMSEPLTPIQFNAESVFTGLPETAQFRLVLEAERRGEPLETVLRDGLLAVAGQITGGGPASKVGGAFPHFLFGL